RPGRVVVEGEVVGEALQAAAVGADRVDLQVAVALRDEGDALAVRREGGVVVEGRVVGEAPGPTGLDVGEVEVPAAGGERREGDGPRRGPGGRCAGRPRRAGRGRGQGQA